MTEFETEREVLREQVERDERELRRAVDDLKDAWARPFKTVERLTERQAPWIFSAVLIGLWLGSRHGRHEEV